MFVVGGEEWMRGDGEGGGWTKEIEGRSIEVVERWW